MTLRTTIETYCETKTHDGKTYHNVDALGRTTYTEKNATETANQLCKLGYTTHIAVVEAGSERCCIYTNPELGGL